MEWLLISIAGILISINQILIWLRVKALENRIEDV